GATDPSCSDVDGDALTYAVGTATSGTASFSAGQLHYAPNANFNGNDSFTYTANDGTVDSSAATVSVTVNPVNDAPVCAAASIVTNEDTAGATDPSCSDVDGDALTYAVGTATSGTASFSAGQLHYAPHRTSDLNDSFTYTANDGTVDSSAATVSVTVNPVND